MICNCGNYTEGNTLKCGSCNRADRKGSKAAPKRVRVRIKPFSKARLKENAVYTSVSRLFIKNHPICQCCNESPSIEVHHKKGRIGDLLTNIKFFLAVCRPCHLEIEANPSTSIENGYSIKRLVK